MTFPRKQLNDGEEVVFDLQPHWWFLAGAVARFVLAAVVGGAIFAAFNGAHAAGIVGSLVLLAGVISFLVRYLQWRTTDLVLPTDRLITRSGVLARQSHEIPLERVNDISCHQSIFERVIHAGDLLIES